MKKYAEILEEIISARAGMIETAKSEKNILRKVMVIAHESGTDSEFDAAKAEYEAAEEKYNAECKHNENLKITIEILTDNAAQAFFAESIETICTIWNKYAGKPHGKKTSEKIRNELFAALGVRVLIDNEYNDATITCYFDFGSKAPFNSLKFYAIRTNGEKVPALIENKIQPLNPDSFRVGYRGAYVEDIPAHVRAIRDAHEKAKEAESAFENAVSVYNNLTRGSIGTVSIREGVKSLHCLIP